MWQTNGAALAEQCRLDGRSGPECQLSQKLLSDFAKARMGWIVAIIVAYMTSNYLRAVRWKDMLRGVGHEVSTFNSIAAVMVGYFANLGVPRSGEFIRAGVLAKYDDAPVETAFGTIVLERIVDVILLAFMLALGFMLHYEKLWTFLSANLPEDGSGIIIILGVLVLGGIAGLLVLRKILKSDGENDHPLVSKIKGMVKGFAEGLGAIKKVPNLPLFIAQSIGIWLLYFLMHYWAFSAFAPTEMLGWKDGIFVFDFGALGIVLPSPGGMGTFHYLIEESLAILGIDRLDGFSLAMIIFFTINIGCNAFFGLLSLIGLPIYNKK